MKLQKYLLVSGGMDSTYMSLLFYERGCKDFLFLHNNTGLRLKSAEKILRAIQEITNFVFIETKFEGNMTSILEESFRALPKAIELIRTNRYYKQVFKCCYWLKERHAYQFTKTHPGIYFSGIKKGDSFRRNLFLKRLREANRFFSFKKKARAWYCYPLRDGAKQSVMLDKFQDYGLNVKHSGCRICPILLLSPSNLKKEPERYVNSRQYYFRLTGEKAPLCNPQQTIPECVK